MSVRGAASRDGLSKGERPAVSLVAGTPADPPSLLKIPCCSIEGEHQKEGRLPSPPFADSGRRNDYHINFTSPWTMRWPTVLVAYPKLGFRTPLGSKVRFKPESFEMKVRLG